MTKNLKNYAAVRTALDKLEAQIKAEAKLDPRLKRGHGRIQRMISNLKIAEAKYEIVHGRKVPKKVVAKRKAAKSGGAKPAPSKKEAATVTRLRAVA